MFHVKQKKLGLIAGASMLGILAISCGGAAASPRGWAEPVENGSTTMVSTGRGRIDGIQADRRAWRFPNDWDISGGAGDLKGVYGAPVVTSDGSTVFLGDYNGRVYAFKPADAPANESAAQKPAGVLDIGDPIIGGVALDDAGEWLYVTSGEKLYALKAADIVSRIGSDLEVNNRWAPFKTNGDIWSVPVLNNGRILLSSIDGNLYSINQSDGKEAWRFRNGNSGLVGTPTIVGDVVLVGGFDSELHAINLSDGTEKWSFKASYWVWSRPVVSGNTLIFGDFNGRLYGVNSSDGTEAWTADLKKGPIVSSVVVTGGTLVVATQDGWVIGLDPTSREVKWSTDIGSSITADLLVGRSGDVLLAPKGCVTPEGQENKVYYNAVDPSNGDLKTALDIC